ncbi:MAG: PatB family C-S lyase [Sterolibacterium sp.]|nr:PatB family C-S lyase [Sterolibacterium sp.]MBP9798958.1 PatB family C-S lyase [Sterolibacterium sp.]
MPTPFDFDHLPDLSTGDSIKWNRYAGRDVLPLWIADMDFAAAPAIVAALQQRVARASFGYAEPWPGLVEAVQQHLQQRYDWAIEADWLVWLPGLVTGLHLACRAVPGSVFSATPVYPPFLSAPLHSGNSLLTAALIRHDDPAQAHCGWGWDFTAVRQALRPDTRLFLLCHPHNPVGRAWSEAELQEIATIATEHRLIVCSDEIHCDLLLDRDRRHRPYATLSAETARHSITLMAPSKAYNIAGLGCAYAIIPDRTLRRTFIAAMQGMVPHVNALGLVACEAAYRDGGNWHTAMLDTLRANRDLLEQEILRLPGLHMTHVEASYLAWIDAGAFARQAGIDIPQRHFERAGLGLSPGSDFALPQADGNPSRAFVRLNFACPPSTLQEALRRMQQAVVFY